MPRSFLISRGEEEEEEEEVPLLHKSGENADPDKKECSWDHTQDGGGIVLGPRLNFLLRKRSPFSHIFSFRFFGVTGYRRGQVRAKKRETDRRKNYSWKLPGRKR